MIHGVEKPTEQMVLFYSTYAIFLCDYSHFCIYICTFEKTTLQSPTKINQIKNDNSCKVLIPCTNHINFISKVQHPNEKLRLLMWSIAVSEHEIKVNLVGF